MSIYRCSECGETKPRDELTAKRVAFQTMGAGWKILKSRVVAWLCRECREKDPVWTSPKWVGTPGHAESNVEKMIR